MRLARANVSLTSNSMVVNYRLPVYSHNCFQQPLQWEVLRIERPLRACLDPGLLIQIGQGGVTNWPHGRSLLITEGDK